MCGRVFHGPTSRRSIKPARSPVPAWTSPASAWQAQAGPSAALPALASIDDRALVAVTGSVHRYGDRRMPVPGGLGVVATAVSAVGAALAGHWAQAIAAGAALILLSMWLVLYARVSAPINRQLTAA